MLIQSIYIQIVIDYRLNNKSEVKIYKYYKEFNNSIYNNIRRPVVKSHSVSGINQYYKIRHLM